MKCRCVDCAYFATRRSPTSEPCEAPRAVRDFEQNHGYVSMPHCFREVLEMSRLDGNRGDHLVITQLLKSERECMQFVQWEPGIGPARQMEIEMQKVAQAAADKIHERYIELNKATLNVARLALVFSILAIVISIVQTYISVVALNKP